MTDVPALTGEFYQLSNMVNKPINKNKYPGELFRCTMSLGREAILHKRKVFNLIDLLSDLGGVIEVFIIIFGMIFFAISE